MLSNIFLIYKTVSKDLLFKATNFLFLFWIELKSFKEMPIGFSKRMGILYSLNILRNLSFKYHGVATIIASILFGIFFSPSTKKVFDPKYLIFFLLSIFLVIIKIFFILIFF